MRFRSRSVSPGRRSCTVGFGHVVVLIWRGFDMDWRRHHEEGGKRRQREKLTRRKLKRPSTTACSLPCEYASYSGDVCERAEQGPIHGNVTAATAGNKSEARTRFFLMQGDGERRTAASRKDFRCRSTDDGESKTQSAKALREGPSRAVEKRPEPKSEGQLLLMSSHVFTATGVR